MTDSLIVRMSSDPKLLQHFVSLTKQHDYVIPMQYEDNLKAFSEIGSMDKGLLVANVASPDDYQTQIKLLSRIQHCLDRCHEITMDLYRIHHKWLELNNRAFKYLNLTYFEELNDLKDGVRKSVLAVALHPIQEGVEHLQFLIDRGETSYKHLMGKSWNVKEGNLVITEYLKLLKFGSGSRLMPDEI